MLTAGAGGATGASQQLRRHQLGRGGGKVAPQSPLEESATTEASRMWHENMRVRWSYCSKNPFFECSFHEIAIEFLLEVVQKAAEKKLNKQQHTNRQNPADPEQLRGRVLDSQNADTSRKCLKNLSPKRPLNPANIPVKEHLRLASVVALSSNGACGAII